LRFFVGLTGGGRVETAANGMFHFYEQRLGLQQFHWGNLFNDIETATHDMMSIADTAKDDAERDRVTEEWHVLMSANMEFICAAVQPKDCAESLQVFRPIEKLFALLKTPIFPDLRGELD
jgi:hypothetical protein